MSSSAATTSEGPGSASGAPNLPAGFTDMFTSRYVETGELRQHVVTGGDGPPLLLVHGWPQTWYAWRLIMPEVARDFSVVAPDQRGTGLSGKPKDGHDTGTLAGDLVEVNEQLVTGREHVYFGFQFAKAANKLPADVVGYYVEALAADPEALRGSFAAYRALDATIAQNEQRKTRRLTLPVLAIGGAEGIGEGAANTMRLANDDVQSVVIPGSGHYCLEEAPGEVAAALTAFLAPYRG